MACGYFHETIAVTYVTIIRPFLCRLSIELLSQNGTNEIFYWTIPFTVIWQYKHLFLFSWSTQAMYTLNGINDVRSIILFHLIYLEL